jgi:hypothetical protein
MEVLLVNLSLKRFFLKPESSQIPNSGSGATRWQISPPIVFPDCLLDSSIVVFDFSSVLLCARGIHGQ